MQDAPLLFGDVRIEPREGRVFLRGQPIHLPPRAFALLYWLASNPQRLVTKDEILDAVWPALAVTEGVVKVTIQLLRQALGDDARAPWLLATVPRRGYRFLPAVRTADLPHPLTSFVGRQQEVSELVGRVGEKGLCTIAGAGGSGKTRLALEVARRAAGSFDHVVWVELAGTLEPELVPHRVASAIGVREHADRDLVEALGDACRTRQVLLVLDNCEHLVAAVAGFVRRLLDLSMPAIAVLATSREPLGIGGERVVQLPPLRVPPPTAHGREILDSDAARLFRDRAALLVPDFALQEDATELALVAQICRRVDGVPLAIELAAARLRLLSLEEIASRLDEAVDFLATGERSVPERHRTLRATVEWSLRLLGSDERRLLAALGAFAGTFTLEAAEAVAPAVDIPRSAVLDIMDRLVAKSVVEPHRARDRAARLYLLDTIRRMVCEGPEAASQEPRVRQFHLAFYRDLAAAAGLSLMSAERSAWIRRLSLDADDLRSALAFCRTSAERREIGLEIAGDLSWFWFFQGSWGEGRHLLRSHVEGWPGEVNAPLVRALFGLGFLDFASGHMESAAERWRRCAADDGLAADRTTAALATSFLSQVAMARSGGLDSALRLAEDASRRVTEDSSAAERAMILNNLGNVRRQRTEPEAALAAYRQAEQALAGSPDAWLQAMLLRNRGILAAGAGDDECAAALLRRSLATLRPEPEPWFVSRGLDELAAVESRRGDPRRAARLLGAAESLRTLIGAPIVPYYRATHEAAVAATREALPGPAFREAWDAGRRLPQEAIFDEAYGPPQDQDPSKEP